MPDIRLPGLRLIVVDPGHFHAALVQKEQHVIRAFGKVQALLLITVFNGIPCQH